MTVPSTLTGQPARPRPRGWARRAGIRLVVLGSLLILAVLIIPRPWLVLACCGLIAAYTVVVLGPEIERLAAIALLVGAVVVGSGSVVWLLLVQPTVDRVGQTTAEFTRRMDQLTHLPKVPSVDVPGAARGALDRAKAAVGGAR